MTWRGRRANPIGGSTTCRKVCSPNTSTTPPSRRKLPPIGTICEREEGRHQREVRRQLEHESVAAIGHQIFFEEQLDAVGQRLQDAPRAGDVGPDAVLHLGDDLALEPDHEHHGDEQQCECDDDLEQHDQHVTEVDVDEQRIEGEHGTRSWLLDSRRGDAGRRIDQRGGRALAWLNTIAAVPLGTPASGSAGAGDRARAVATRTVVPDATPSASKSAGLRRIDVGWREMRARR